VSRWKSPQAAARRAERTDRETEQRRREKRRSWLIVIGVALASIGLTVADYLWLHYQARQRHERRRPHHQQVGTTNFPISGSPQLTEKSPSTNHE
jgi:hypothetical protein